MSAPAVLRGATVAGARMAARVRPPTPPPVLVVGNGRSGTSWVGGTLGAAPGVSYYREPCHPALHGLRGGAAEEVWGRYVPPEGHDAYFSRTLGDAFLGVPAAGGADGLRTLPARLRRPPRVVVKEVAAFASLEWVCRRWSPQVLVVLRHPGAYVASVLRLRQAASELARLRVLRAQEGTRARLPAPLLTTVDGVEDVVGATAAAWAVRTWLVLARARPAWTLVRYEQLAADPVTGFRSLFAHVGLHLDASLEDAVRARSTHDEPGSFSTARVSASRVDAWRRELAPNDVARLREVIEPFELPVYSSDADW